MIFANIPAGASVFVDANTLVYHFTNDAKFGAACTQLVKRLELRQLHGFTSAHVLADVVHRLMTLEAVSLMNWPATRMAARLRQHHDTIPRLSVYRQAIAAIPHLAIQVLPLTNALVEAATSLSHQYELLTGDALIVATMQQHGLDKLASNDADFDRLPGLNRFAPV